MCSTSSATERTVIPGGRAGRRALLAAALGGALLLVPGRALLAHTPYRQWKVYRQRHLMIGASREDAATYPKAKEIQGFLEEHLPEASARVAPGPDPPASLGSARDGPDPHRSPLRRGCGVARKGPAPLSQPGRGPHSVAVRETRDDRAPVVPSGARLDIGPDVRRARRGASRLLADAGPRRDPPARRRSHRPPRRAHAPASHGSARRGSVMPAAAKSEGAPNRPTGPPAGSRPG